MDRALAIVGLTARGFAVLYEIHRETPATQRDLARRLGLEPSTTSELLRRLERKGLIVRLRPPRGHRGADRRAQEGRGGDAPVRLTGAGSARLGRAERLATRLEATWADRVRRAPDGEHGEARFQGLRRWLREATAALAEGPPGDPVS